MSNHSPDISVKIGKLNIESPTILASGILGQDKKFMVRIAQKGPGAVTFKSLTMEPRLGHANPIITQFDGGLMNAVGYANKGIAEGTAEFADWREKVPLVASVVGKDADEFAHLAEKAGLLNVAAVEIALSCPHTPGFGLLAGHGTPEATGKIVKAVRRRLKKPLWVKLSPSVMNLGEIAKTAEHYGADAINMGNTAGPGMQINIETCRPVLHFKSGGMSGPAIKPLTMRCVYDIFATVKIPVIATGGILTGEDVIEAFMAGASAVGIGSAIYYRGLGVFTKINREIRAWLKSHRYKYLRDLRGAAHAN